MSSNPEEAFRRRGAPFTFDAKAFVAAVRALQEWKVTTTSEPAFDFLCPSFDHAIQDPVQDDIIIRSTTKFVILEGNYTMLDQSPWNEVASIVQER